MSLIMSFLVVTISFANYANGVNDAIKMEEQEESRVKITLEEIPEIVQESFENSDFKNFTILETHKLVNTDGTFFEYTINMSGHKWAIYFNSEGEYISKKEVD